MQKFVKWIQLQYSATVAGIIVALTWVIDQMEFILVTAKEYVLGPVIGLLIPKLYQAWQNRKDNSCPSAHKKYTKEERTRSKQDLVSANKQLEIQTDIQAKIERLLVSIDGCDRVLIHKFHNGGKFYTAKSTQKMALVYQACLYKYFKIDNEMSGGNFNLEKMGSILKKVVDKGYLHLTINKDKEKYMYTPYFQLLEEDGVEANHLRIIRSGRKSYRNVGLLSLHFIKKKKRGLTVDEVLLIDRVVREIQQILTDDQKGYPEN